MASFRPVPGYPPGACPFTRLLVVFASVAFLLLAAPDTLSAGPFSGRVIDPDRRPVPDAIVLVAGPLGVTSARTNAEGVFHIADLAPARYRVTVRAPGLASEPHLVHVDADGVHDLTLTTRLTPIAEAVVVSAAQVPQPLSETAAAATVIDREEVRVRQLETVSDALRSVPGLAVARNGGRGALTSVFPRGGDSDYTLVLVDGIRQNAFGGGFDLALLPFGDVEQVEVVRGPQSALYGSDAIGGLVHLTTRHGERPSATALFEAGGQETIRSVAAARGVTGQWSFGGAVEHGQSEGFTGVAPATGEQVTNDDWHSTAVSASVGWTRSPATVVRVDGRWLGDERGNPGPFGSNPSGSYTAVDREARGDNSRRQVGLDARFPWGDWLEGRVQQRIQVTGADFDNRFHSAFGDSLTESRRLTARVQTDLIAWAGTGVSFGLEALDERARNTFITGEAFQQIPIDRWTIGYFAEARHDLGPRASVTAGVRLEQIHREALEGSPNEFSPRPRFPADTIVSANPRLAAGLVVWQDGSGAARTRLRASAGTGIRPPDAFEIAFTDNPELKPERSRSLDVGIVHELHPAVAAEATWFHNRYDDLIVAVGRAFTDASRYRTDNISNARASGAEVSLSWRGAAGLGARAAYTWLDTKILAVDRSGEAPPPFRVGDRLLRRPEHQGSLDVTWVSGRAAAFASVRARGETLDVEPSFGASAGLFDVPGFVVADAGLTWRLTPQLDLFARALNLFDREFEEVFGFPAQRRTGLIGVRLAVRP